MAARLKDPDLQALDDIWPIGRQLAIPDGGTVVIAGAYKGRYMHYIAERYPGTRLILGLEPQPDCAAEATLRTIRYPNCSVIPVALVTYPYAFCTMGKWGTDGCSLVHENEPTGEADPLVLATLMEEVKEIDCFICNMEGYEYELLPHIFEDNWHQRIHSMAIQFHPEFARDEQAIHTSLNEYYGESISSPGWSYWRKQ